MVGFVEGACVGCLMGCASGVTALCIRECAEIATTPEMADRIIKGSTKGGAIVGGMVGAIVWDRKPINPSDLKHSLS